jgi:acyl phosphate:glycerol-3-phosphate acyltransferase
MFNTYNLTMIAIITISYLLGSIPSAYLVAKYNDINIFEVGSGNMGGTNIVRTLGFRWALPVVFVDVLKGIIAIYIAREIAPASKIGASTVAATVAVIGHNWSLFAGIVTGTLRGGKGAATAFGTMLVLVPLPIVLVMLLVTIGVIALTRYVSLGVLVGFGLAILWITVLTLQEQLEPSYLYYGWMLAVMFVVRHRGNIQRLIAGTERRIGERI